MNLLEEAKTAGMTELQMNAVMGSLLGDGYLVQSSAAKKAIRWNHSLKQMDYVQHKYRTLSGFATREPFTKPNPGYGDYWAVLTLKSLGVFHCMYAMLYADSRKKTVTQEYLDSITHPIALAWWFMDDGTRQRNSNTASIATNGFSEREVRLLSDWLKTKWEIANHVSPVVHSSTGATGWVIHIQQPGYLRLVELTKGLIPDCMLYKLTVLTTTCAVCGKEIPIQHGLCCSPICASIYNKEARRLYESRNKEHLNQRKRAWKIQHKKQILEAARARYAQMSPEKKAELAAYARMWRARNRNQHLEYRRQYRQRMKEDPAYRSKLQAERARYYARLKQDPERYARKLELSRLRRRREDVRIKEREYLRRHRAEKLAQNPEKQAKHDALIAHNAQIASMSAQERREHDRQLSLQSYYKRKSEMSAEEWAARNTRINERQRERMAKLKADPEKYAKFLEDEKRRRAARKAKRIAASMNASNPSSTSEN